MNAITTLQAVDQDDDKVTVAAGFMGSDTVASQPYQPALPGDEALSKALAVWRTIHKMDHLVTKIEDFLPKQCLEFADQVSTHRYESLVALLKVVPDTPAGLAAKIEVYQTELHENPDSLEGWIWQSLVRDSLRLAERSSHCPDHTDILRPDPHRDLLENREAAIEELRRQTALLKPLGSEDSEVEQIEAARNKLFDEVDELEHRILTTQGDSMVALLANLRVATNWALGSAEEDHGTRHVLAAYEIALKHSGVDPAKFGPHLY